MQTRSMPNGQHPIAMGMIGTGFVAKVRAEALRQEDRARFVAVWGPDIRKTREFAASHEIEGVCSTWQDLVSRSDLDVVVVCNVNADHAIAVRAAIEAGKSVIVEYPLSLSPLEAQELMTLAERKGLQLHVEHIELLGGLHQAMRQHLPKIGTPRYVRYCTAVPQMPVPEKWTYHTGLFGFPLVGALSRVHRLTNLFGAVEWVASQIQYDDRPPGGINGYFKQVRCVAQLKFRNGMMAEVLYAKGEHTWRSQRWMEIEGDRGALIFDGDTGTWLSETGETPIEVGSRRGLFAKDMTFFLDGWFEGQPLYITPAESVYALHVAAAAEEAATTGKTVPVTVTYPGASAVLLT